MPKTSNKRLSVKLDKFQLPLIAHHSKVIVRLIVLLALVYEIAVIVFDYADRLQASYADTGFFLEMTSKFFDRGVGESRVASSISVLFTHLIPLPADEICRSLPIPTEEFTGNVFSTHPYLISEPLSFVGDVTGVPPHFWAAGLLLGSIVSGLYSIYRFMSELYIHKVLVIGALLTVLSFPVLTQSVLGQAYFDRLMFGPAIVLTLGLFRANRIQAGHSTALVISLVTLALISERGALLAGLLGCGYNALLNGRKILTKGTSRTVFVAGVVATVYSVIFFSYIATFATGGSGALSLASISNRVDSLIGSPDNLATFGWIISPLLLLSFFSGRTLLLVIIALFPNLLISIGGAELTGFGTHYHQFYLPVLVSAAVIGLCNVLRFAVFKDSRFRTLSLQGMAVLAVLTGSFGMWNSLAAAGRTEDPGLTARRAWLPSLSKQVREEQTNRQHARAEARKFLGGVLIDSDSSFSVPEGWYPFLYTSGTANLFYWPMGVGIADYVIAPIRNDRPVVFPHYDIGGKEAELSRCVEAELDEKYQLLNDSEVSFSRYRLYKKR